MHLDLDPTSGREQQGQRYVIVLTVAEFNRFGLALVAPNTRGGQLSRENGFTVSLLGAGGKTQGVVLCNQIRMLDFKQRGGKIIESTPAIWLLKMFWHELECFWISKPLRWANWGLGGTGGAIIFFKDA